MIYSFDDPNDHLDTLNKLILNAINELAPLMKTKFTRPPPPWMKDFDINKLLKERDHRRYEAHSKETPESWEKLRAMRNKTKGLSIRETHVSTKKCFNQKTKMKYGKSYILYLVPIQKH